MMSVTAANRSIDLAAERLHSFRIAVPTDGSCQYHALAHSSGETTAVLKCKILDEMYRHPEQYRDFISDCTWEDYFATIAAPNKYGDFNTLQAAATILDAQVWVLRSDETHLIRRVAHPASATDKVITLTFRGADDGHYDALQVNDALRQFLASSASAIYLNPESQPHKTVTTHARNETPVSSDVIFTNVQRSLAGHLDELTELAHNYAPTAISCSETDIADNLPSGDFLEKNLKDADLDALRVLRIPGYQLPRFVHDGQRRAVTPTTQ